MGSEKEGTVANIYNPHSPSFLHNIEGLEKIIQDKRWIVGGGKGEFTVILSLAEKQGGVRHLEADSVIF